MQVFLDHDELARIAREHRRAYSSAEPFPHVVLDGVLPDAALDLALDVFPEPDSAVWKVYDNPLEKKLETQGEDRLDDAASLLLYQFNSAPFLAFLEELSGIEGLIPDPYFHGGGFHQIEPGGKLSIHADFSGHPTLPLDRRLNVLIYLNRDWDAAYGGHLELWNRDATECCHRVEPVFNRMVVFSTNETSFHGHPEPLRCPPGRTRKSIALYYFTAREGTRDHTTRFVRRPGEEFPASVEFATSGYGLKDDRFARRSSLKRFARGVTPPFVFEATRRFRRSA